MLITNNCWPVLACLLKAQKALVIYEDPLELENELECTKQAKLQKIQELSKHKEELT